MITLLIFLQVIAPNAQANMQASAQRQAQIDAQAEQSRRAYEADVERNKQEAYQAYVSCRRNKECMAEMVCHQVENITMWKRAIHDEMGNTSGIVNFRLLHEYGAAIQQAAYYVREDLKGTKFTVKELCR